MIQTTIPLADFLTVNVTLTTYADPKENGPTKELFIEDQNPEGTPSVRWYYAEGAWTSCFRIEGERAPPEGWILANGDPITQDFDFGKHWKAIIPE